MTSFNDRGRNHSLDEPSASSSQAEKVGTESPKNESKTIAIGKTQLDYRTAIALLVAAVFFMENLDATVIATSLPAMARDFGTVPAHLSVGVLAYLVALTVLIPIGGWATDRFGARRVLSLAIVGFTIASVLCAASNSLLTFTVARILQGSAGALMVPVGRLVVMRVTPKEGVVRAVAMLTWPALVAPVLGPPLGGWISTHWSWHWIFLLNLPLGILAWVASLILIHEGPSQPHPFDVVGFLLTALGLGSFMGSIELASRPDLPAIGWIATLAIGLLLLALAAWHLKRAKQPLMDLAPLRILTFRVTAVGGSLFRTAIGTAPFLLPLMFQVGFGWSAMQAGMLLLWLFAGNICMKPGTTWIMNRFGFRTVLIGNGLLVAAGFAACALLEPTVSKVWVAGLMFVCGMTRSMQFTAFNTMGFSDVQATQMRDATTLFSVLQQLNAGLGIAVGALLLAVAALINGIEPSQVGTAEFHLAFWLIAALVMVAILDCSLLPENAGQRILSPKATEDSRKLT